MPNYNIENCASGDTYVVSATSLSVGEVVSFFIGETSLCGTVLGVTSDPITPLSSYNVSHTDCLNCYQENEKSFLVRACTNPALEGPVNAIYFSQNPIGRFSTIEGPFWEGSLCFEILGVLDELFEAPFLVTGYYDDCDCEGGIPRSANTETVICVVCSGETSTIIPPHAVYTDAQGTAVTQLNTVVLGGPNGLNN